MALSLLWRQLVPLDRWLQPDPQLLGRQSFLALPLDPEAQ